MKPLYRARFPCQPSFKTESLFPPIRQPEKREKQRIAELPKTHVLKITMEKVNGRERNGIRPSDAINLVMNASFGPFRRHRFFPAPQRAFPPMRKAG